MRSGATVVFVLYSIWRSTKKSSSIQEIFTQLQTQFRLKKENIVSVFVLRRMCVDAVEDIPMRHQIKPQSASKIQFPNGILRRRYTTTATNSSSHLLPRLSTAVRCPAISRFLYAAIFPSHADEQANTQSLLGSFHVNGSHFTSRITHLLCRLNGQIKRHASKTRFFELTWGGTNKKKQVHWNQKFSLILLNEN